MKDTILDSVAEPLSLVATALVSSLFTVAGVLVEQAGVHDLLTGHTILGVWELGMGFIPLIVGVYLLGYQRLWPHLQSVAAGE